MAEAPLTIKLLPFTSLPIQKRWRTLSLVPTSKRRFAVLPYKVSAPEPMPPLFMAAGKPVIADVLAMIFGVPLAKLLSEAAVKKARVCGPVCAVAALPMVKVVLVGLVSTVEP